MIRLQYGPLNFFCWACTGWTYMNNHNLPNFIVGFGQVKQVQAPQKDHNLALIFRYILAVHEYCITATTSIALCGS